MRATTAQRNAFRKEQRLRQDGRCWYCNEPMIVTRLKPGEHPHPRMETIEHRYSKLNPMRYERQPQSDGRRRLLLACFECNQRRGREDQTVFAPECEHCFQAGMAAAEST
jgi:hypothetical protein